MWKSVEEMKYVHLAFCCLLLGITTGYGQKSINSSGKTINSSGSVSYSVGQSFVSSYSTAQGNVSEGVQLPFEYFVLGTDDEIKIEVHAIVYPNPTKANAFLRLENTTSRNLKFSLYSTLGRKLSSGNITSTLTLIPTQNLGKGVYFLQIQTSSQKIKVFKIIKK